MTASVSRLSVKADCPVCGSRAQWQVGPANRSCGRCLDHVLRVAIREGGGTAAAVHLIAGAR